METANPGINSSCFQLLLKFNALFILFGRINPNSETNDEYHLNNRGNILKAAAMVNGKTMHQPDDNNDAHSQPYISANQKAQDIL